MKQSENLKLVKILPIIRGILAEATGDLDRPFLRIILKSATDKKSIDKIISGKRYKTLPLHLDSFKYSDSLEKLKKQLECAVNDFKKLHRINPQVILIPKIGIIYIEETKKTDMPLQNEVALVTGAAGAIGFGICKGLLEKGCYVAATDLPGERLENTVNVLQKIAPNRIVGVGINVTDKNSVTNGFNEVICTWGGVDIVIPNAGIPLIAPLTEMSLSDFRNLQKVNVEGTLLTLAEAGRHMKLQGTGGDIVVISTKNVFAPGANFGAYSATKAAAHQLGRIASLELAEFGIRVNMVAPDAVFCRGKDKIRIMGENWTGQNEA